MDYFVCATMTVCHSQPPRTDLYTFRSVTQSRRRGNSQAGGIMTVMRDRCPHSPKYQVLGWHRIQNVVPCALLLAATLMITRVGAAAFTPIKPPVCPSWQEIPFTYRVGG